MQNQDSPFDQTDSIKDQFRKASSNVLKINNDFSVTREKGLYGVFYAMPSKALRGALSVDREMLVLVSTFSDQQSRTIQTAKDLVDESEGRLDPTTIIILHKDPRGNTKLKKWGREQGLVVLPIYSHGQMPSGNHLLKALSYELFSYDSFDVTGPVADDMQFYGRREEAIDLAKKLQSGQIRACFGIRKIGKTSILHRVINEVRANYDCSIFLIDAQRDAIFELDAASLLNSLASALEKDSTAEGIDISVVSDSVDLSTAAERLRLAVFEHPRHILFVFDEVDFLTPTSPTAAHWRTEFNKFWRNLRAIYQSAAAGKRNLSLLISGVSSKWFSEESIDGVENAVLSFVPEEYLSPLPRGASSAMIRRLGKNAGLVFTASISEYIAETCADMPFWIRKACSFIHNRIEIGLRPFEPQRALISDLIKDFVATDGIAMSEVALGHLFRVYPELKGPALRLSKGESGSVNARTLRTIERYGIIRLRPSTAVSGQMMASGLDSFAIEAVPVAVTEDSLSDSHSDYGDWADELAIISRRRNNVERKLRSVVINFIRFSAMAGAGSAKERVLKCVDAKRASDLQRYDLDELVTKLFWLELIAIIKKEWALFERIFGDRSSLEKYTTIVNERPDAHAKQIDEFDVAYHRTAIGWFEDKLGKLQ